MKMSSSNYNTNLRWNRVLPLLFLFYLIISGHHYAYGISGACANCHTMHNSQNGESVTGGEPNEYLLVFGCVGCHSSDIGKTNSFGAPVVMHTTEPTGQGKSKTNAAGDFYWVNISPSGNAAKGHNVIDLPGVTSEDGNIGLTPPGWDPDATLGFVYGRVANGENQWTSQLTCAGQYGCHGDHSQQGSDAGIKGAHHANENGSATWANEANTLGSSYRFLGNIKGLEDPDWNWDETASQHNEYHGSNNAASHREADGTPAYTVDDTMSFLCAECHGLFHSEIDADNNSGTPWVRHPTDIVMPTGKEYDDYNSDNNDGSPGEYSLEAPVARGAVPNSSSSNINIGNTGVFGSILMCLSCHRAHGSTEDDLLRWTYTDIQVGNGATNGCFICHTEKN
jgi:predicted CXXCH cytochrome family protein